MTPLDNPLRRQLKRGEHSYTLTADPLGLKLTQNGRRDGVIVTWKDLVDGDAAAIAAALAAALRASNPDLAGAEAVRRLKGYAAARRGETPPCTVDMQT